MITWGFEKLGGDSSSVQAKLKHIEKIIGFRDFFEAIRQDGERIIWGKI